MRPAMRKQLRAIADAAGATGFELVRENRHVIVDFIFAGRPPVRQVMSASMSDGARGLKNQISELRKAARTNP